MTAAARYVVGIDLGTTNSALAYVDRRSGRAATRVRPFPVPQLVASGEVGERHLLPSFIYLPGEHELPEGASRLPWRAGGGDIVGELAREQGGLVPGRLVASAKSWLCHDRVERRAPILPWNGAPDAPRISPVEASARVLAHLRDAWDATVAKGDKKRALAAQEVVIGVPASFDAVARRLTLEAANAAGLARPTLLEEPQAALYAWVAANEGRVAEALPPGSLVLVVDVGGGTTDFALVAVREDGGLERTAVSDHLLLGGDNMDLALARAIEPRFRRGGGGRGGGGGGAGSGTGTGTDAGEGGAELDARDFSALRHAARRAKEVRLAEGGHAAVEAVAVTLPGAGTRLVRDARTAELSRADVLALALDGFFPKVPLEDTTPKRSRTGLQEMGLPFVADPAITRHLGAFLRRHAPEGARLAAPTAVLMNGGVLTNRIFRERVLDTIAGWVGGRRPVELVSQTYDLAVAVGASYYGLVRRERGLRIRGGVGRAYYVGVETAGKAAPTPVCLIPRGLEAEKPVALKLPMTLQANVPVRFPFYYSSVRDDAPGDLVADARVATDEEEGELEELPPLVTVLRAGTRRTSAPKEVPVELVAKLAEVGVLEIACHATDGTDRRWDLELSVRLAPLAAAAKPAGDGPRTRPGTGAGTDRGTGREAEPAGEGDAPPDPGRLARARDLIAAAFAGPPGPYGPLARIGRDLEDVFGAKREAWSLRLCRALFELVYEQREARRASAEHEARFYNLAAFCLRPGFGAALDDFRVSQMWKVAINGLLFEKSDAARLEWWIFERRIAGGLGKGHQEQVHHRVREDLLGRGGGRKHIPRQEQAELWRLAASLELIPYAAKEELGAELLRKMAGGEGPPRWGLWALGRLGTRLPQYGPVNECARPSFVGDWLRRAIPLLDAAGADEGERERAVYSIVQMARQTGDPARDVPARLREAAADALRRLGATAAQVHPLLELVPAAPPEQRLFYGDTVPAGLKLREPAAAR